MLGRLLTVLVAFIWACVAAGLTQALFATTPAELANLPQDVAGDRMEKVFESGIFAAAQALAFSAPFALVAAAIGEWRRVRSWTFYAIVGVAISLIGFLAQYSSELPGQPTIVNNYALSAFATAGFLAGLVYWLIAGRAAGGRNDTMQAPTRPQAPVSTSVPSTKKA